MKQGTQAMQKIVDAVVAKQGATLTAEEARAFLELSAAQVGCSLDELLEVSQAQRVAPPASPG